MPGRKWYLVAVLLFILGMGAMVLFRIARWMRSRGRPLSWASSEDRRVPLAPSPRSAASL
jgi:hypothetical protein